MLINTVGWNTFTYTDSVFMNPPIQYRVDAVDSYGTVVSSNIVTFTTGCGFAIPCNYKGTGSDGIYTGGTLQRGVVYNFSSINLTQDIVLAGNGQILIFVTGNVTTNGYDIRSTPSTAPVNNLGTGITVCGSPVPNFTYVNKPTAVGGTGGEYFITCPSTWTPVPGCAFNGGDANSAQTGAGGNGAGNFLFAGGPCSFPTTGGAGGTVASPNGLAGGVGVSGSFIGPWAGNGGGAGGHALGHEGLIIICQNFTATASTQFIGVGGAGGNGGNAGNGVPILNSNTYQGSGGGAGGNGGNGMSVYIKTYGTYTNAGSNLLSGGPAGIGGTGGTAAGTCCCPSQTAGNGGNGGNGTAGVNGGLFLL